MQVDVQQIKEQVVQQAELLHRLNSELRKVIVGQEHMLSRLIIGMLTHGHVLLEGVPGLAKTTAIKALADALSTSFQRIQFTPDLLPADLIGTMIYMPGAGGFQTRKGPIFANFILADEINRAPSKVQSALLEAMQEKQVTIGDETFPLEGLFLVMATQNPIEQEGTYPLPEAQVDRFMLKVKIDYPKLEEERKILDMALDGTSNKVKPVMSPSDIFQMQEVVRRIYVDDQVKGYIINLVQSTRSPARFGMKDLAPLIEYGGSPRASIFLGLAARANAFLNGRGYVTPQDVKDTAYDVLRHRVILTYEAEAEQVSAEQVISTILSTVPIPDLTPRELMPAANVADILKKVQQIQIVANRTVNDLFAGQYKSVFRGGMEFDEVRPYQPGDDIRTIDWNVTARTGDCFIKRYCEERELTVLFVVDISASGIFGSTDRSKLELVIEIAAMLMFSALKNNDKAGLVTFCDDIIEFIPPRKGKAHVLRMIRQLVDVHPVPRETNIGAALEFLNRVQKRRAVVFLISDFLGELPRKTLAISNQRHDLTAITVSDQCEQALPDVGFLRLRDAETGEVIEVDTRHPRVRELFASYNAQRGDALSQQLKRMGVDQLPVGTQGDYLLSLRKFFRMREKRFR